MVILGVCNANDSGSALIVDGEIICAVNEERFIRRKCTREFPINSIEYALNSNGLNIGDVDFIGCGAWKGIDTNTTLPQLIEEIFLQLEYGQKDTKNHISKRIQSSIKSDQKVKESLFLGLQEMGFDQDIIITCDHHYSHALTAYCCSPFKNAFVLTADGRGDFRSITLWKGSEDNKLELVEFATELSSPGSFYGFITKYLGFVPDRHEGKVTGLSGAGKMSEAYDILTEGYFFDPKSQLVRSKIGDNYLPFQSIENKALFAKLGKFSREDIAFAAQKILEEVLTSFLMKHLDGQENNSVNICLSGGCFANVKLNHELFSLPATKNIYVFPQMGDGGNALGGALNVATSKTSKTHFDFPTVYLGPEYSDDQILSELKRNNLNFHKLNSKNKSELVSEQIVKGEIVGWFQGKMEYGPRALGGRSILVDASKAEVTSKLNRKLQRNDFMPFAPVTIDIWAERCFVGWKPDHIASKFMTTCYKCTDLLKEKCPAIVHLDNTARPQVVFRDENSEYYDTIKLYIEKTGNPAIINTSFNFHEEPIVMSPHDAINCYLDKNITALVIGNYLVL
jgi:carbamoyltransferase